MGKIIGIFDFCWNLQDIFNSEMLSKFNIFIGISHFFSISTIVSAILHGIFGKINNL